jgi:hypothetical protein
MPVYGDTRICDGGCSWHGMSIDQKSTKDIESCGAEVLWKSDVMVAVNMIEPHLDI